jgi:hypothetical protein
LLEASQGQRSSVSKFNAGIRVVANGKSAAVLDHPVCLASNVL